MEQFMNDFGLSDVVPIYSGRSEIYSVYSCIEEKELVLKQFKRQNSTPSEIYTLDHPNIIHMYAHNQNFELMQKADGNLYDFFHSQHLRMSKTQLDNFFYSLANALTYLEKNNLVHCDLRPQNILYIKSSDNFIPLITDFESCVQPGEKQNHQSFYSAPELFNQESVSSKTDVWSLAAIYYEAITKIQPFIIPGQEPTQLIKKGKFNKSIRLQRTTKDFFKSCFQVNQTLRLDLLGCIQYLQQHTTPLSKITDNVIPFTTEQSHTKSIISTSSFQDFEDILL